MSLVQHAAGAAESRTRAATEDAHRLSQQLRAANGRIEDLEAEVKYQEERVERAEQWLHRREPPSRSNALAHLVSH
jgi:TolA-binding protein